MSLKDPTLLTAVCMYVQYVCLCACVGVCVWLDFRVRLNKNIVIVAIFLFNSAPYVCVFYNITVVLHTCVVYFII